MVGFAHARRLAAIVLAAALPFAASGCYVGSSTMGPDHVGIMCPLGVDLEPGKISHGGDTADYLTLWQPDPTAVIVQFAVTDSDSTGPITVDAEFLPTPTPSWSLGVVWDGTHSTGTKSIPWSSGTAFWLYVHTPKLAHVVWWMMALDSSGKEVGFTCVPIEGWGVP